MCAQDEANVNRARVGWGIPEECFMWAGREALELGRSFGMVVSPRDDYPDGLLQPGTHVVSRQGILFHWHIEPARMNLGGAKDRPVPSQILRVVLQRLEAGSLSPDPGGNTDASNMSTKGLCTCGAWQYVCCECGYCRVGV
mmetsp:Transcript_14601/g.41491  ORF Transcript_14601/g.41491 Transcript_14601/m.41491 type:complete len:141 (+) Transcript_14601:298-720(+)